MSNSEKVESLVSAYNARDIDAVAAMLSPDLKFFHFNHGFVLDRDGLCAALRFFAEEAMPDRRMEPASRVIEAGDLVVREGYFTGTPKVDIPFGKAGELVNIKVCTIFRLDDSGRVAEWTDYG